MKPAMIFLIGKNFIRSFAGMVALVGAFALTVTPFSRDAEAANIFRIATASKAGTFYPIGKLIAKGISGRNDCTSAEKCGIPGLIALAQVSNGSVANVEAVSSGSIEAGLAQADVIYWAYSGTGRFANRSAMTGLRTVANLYPGSLHIVTSARTGIRRVNDLKGKRVALDEPGSGTLATAELILSSVGIGKSDLKPLYIKHIHAGPMLAEGKLDAFFFVAGYPTRSVLEVSKKINTRFVPLAQSTMDSLFAERPYFAAGTIPAGAYPGLNTEITTVDIGTQLIVNKELDEQLAYDITAALWNQRTRRLLDEGHPKGSQVRLATAVKGVAVPLHPGAARFYREVGLIKK